jgi:hypothetical protein
MEAMEAMATQLTEAMATQHHTEAIATQHHTEAMATQHRTKDMATQLQLTEATVAMKRDMLETMVTKV